MSILEILVRFFLWKIGMARGRGRDKVEVEKLVRRPPQWKQAGVNLNWVDSDEERKIRFMVDFEHRHDRMCGWKAHKDSLRRRLCIGKSCCLMMSGFFRRHSIVIFAHSTNSWLFVDLKKNGI